MKYEDGGIKLTASQKKLPSKSPALLGLREKDFLAHSEFNKRQNQNKTPLKNGTKFTGIFVFFDDKVINTSSMESSNFEHINT